jgi:dienelactone hydrolase
MVRGLRYSFACVIIVVDLYAVSLFRSHEILGFSLNKICRRKRQRSFSGNVVLLSRPDDDDISPPPMDLPGIDHPLYDTDELESMTVKQLKQQLRLRGMRLHGNKAQLIDRLQNFDIDVEENDNAHDATKEFVDISAYLDESDRDKTLKSTDATKIVDNAGTYDDDRDYSPETWGTDARLSTSSDYDDKRLVIDSLSRTVLEFKGSNQTYVEAVIIATRDALKPYMRGGGSSFNLSHPVTIAKATEQRLYEIQTSREVEAATPINIDDSEGLDEGDETGIFRNVLRRDVSDWGKYTVTGAQLSAQEVQGVLLLSDVHGAHSSNTIALAEKIAFECQPVIVMIPDLFRGDPWVSSSTNTSNRVGQTYEQWRETHDELRVSVDIRAAAACLRETYGVSSVVVWGTCYGGGRALEAASGWCQSIHDVDGSTIGPSSVEPMVAIAWYPTRYNASALFGRNHVGQNVTTLSGLRRKFAVMCVFAGHDEIPGATVNDASVLKQLLDDDDRVVDHMIKVFPQRSHGFAHLRLAQEREFKNNKIQFLDEEFTGAGSIEVSNEDADVASLLSTAFMETYSRAFLPTVGPPIRSDDEYWDREVVIGEVDDVRKRNIRDELNYLNENFVDEPMMSGPRIDPTDTTDDAAITRLLRSMQPSHYDGKYKVLDDDDLPTIYKKLLSADENFQLF